MNGKAWTPQEDELLREKFESLTCVELASILEGRSAVSIKHRIGRLGLERTVRAKVPWTEQEDAFIREHYKEMTCAEIAGRLGNRTLYAVQQRAGKLGLDRSVAKAGDRFGRLEVVSVSLEQTDHGKRQSVAKVKCDCGVEKRVAVRNLVSGHVTSCGCRNREAASERLSRANEKGDGRIGERFGRLVVIGEKRVDEGEDAFRVLCVCDCGTPGDFLLHNLRRGRTQSCGCLKDEKLVERSRTHGESKTRLYRLWAGMWDRCTNPNDKSWRYYGGKGVRVDPSWEDYEVFRNWALANGYAEDLELDRIDSNGSYTPENTRWVTVVEQANNRSNNRRETLWGETKTLAEWTRDPRCVVSAELLYARIDRKNWTLERALTTPARRHNLTDSEKQTRSRARWAVKSALESGRLVKPSHCEYPGCERLEVSAHHHKGYDKEFRLDVVWLCDEHHAIADFDVQ